MTPPVGIFNQMWASSGLSDRETVQSALDEIRHAEAEDFASVWIGEHNLPPGAEGAFHGRVPATEVFLAYVAAMTSRIAVGTGIKILATNSAPLVSTDFNHDSHSSTFDLTQTVVMEDKRFCRVLSWYDNEWGFSNRMADTAVAIGKLI